jgi:hypothetical protein
MAEYREAPGRRRRQRLGTTNEQAPDGLHGRLPRVRVASPQCAEHATEPESVWESGTAPFFDLTKTKVGESKNQAEVSEEASAQLKSAIETGVLHACSKIALEVECCDHERSGLTRFGETARYRDKFDEVGALLRNLKLANGTFVSLLPMAPWGTVSGPRAGAFEIALAWWEHESSNIEGRRVVLFSKLKAGRWPRVGRLLDDLHRLVPFLRATPAAVYDALWAKYTKLQHDFNQLELQCKRLEKIEASYAALAICVEDDKARNHKRKKLALRRCLTRMLRAVAWRVFEQWRGHVIDQKQMKAKALKVVRRLVNRALVEGFERWREHAVEEKQMQAKALKVVRRLVIRALVEGFKRWRFRYAEHRELVGKSKRMLARLQRRAGAVCVIAWRRRVVGEARKRGIIQRAVSRLFWRRLSQSFDGWCQAVSLEAHAIWQQAEALSQGSEVFHKENLPGSADVASSQNMRADVPAERGDSGEEGSKRITSDSTNLRAEPSAGCHDARPR